MRLSVPLPAGFAGEIGELWWHEVDRALCCWQRSDSCPLPPPPPAAPRTLTVAQTMVLLKNLRPPTEGVRHEQAETSVVMDGHQVGCGTLYIAETYVTHVALSIILIPSLPFLDKHLMIYVICVLRRNSV